MAEQLANATGQAVAVAVWGNFGPTLVRMIDSRQPMHVAMRAGTVMSPFGTATAGLSQPSLRPERIMELMAATALGGPPQERIVAGSTQHLALIAEARTSSPAWLHSAVGRPIPGSPFSTPVFEHDGQAALVLTLLGHQDHVASAWSSPMATAVKQAARGGVGPLGYRKR